jgi:hypothetical protein
MKADVIEIDKNMPVSIIDALDVNTVQETMKKIQTFQTIVQKTLKRDHDFGDIPGTSKPTLLKPGAEKICMMMGLSPEYEIISETEDFKNDFFSYTFKCRLLKNGNVVSEGVGSCNSKESKYRYKWVDENNLPFGIDKDSLESSDRYNKIQYKVENPDICSLANTILKMAKKRALVDATLQVASLSEIFTQDVEDMQEYMRQEQTQTMTVKDAANLKLHFGKYKGTPLGDIYKNDIGYIKWLLENERTDRRIKKACEILKDAAQKKHQAKEEKESEPNSEEMDFDDTEVDYEGTPFEEDEGGPGF